MATITVNITFNDKQVTISLNGLTTIPIVKTEKAEDWKSMHYIEYSIDKYCKWIFSWSYLHGEQFFKIEQQYLFPSDSRPTPMNYNAWTTLAFWSYIDKPSIGTIQTNKVYCRKYNKSQIPEIESIVWTTKGCPYGDWNTSNAENGYFR